jgi:SAM-dependent methyltransferase
LNSSIPLFDSLAADYDAHFDVPHRRAYDELAWELVQPLLPVRGGLVVDAGCGVGRWASRLVALGYEVVGIEHAPAMAAAARARMLPGFRVLEQSIEDVELGECEADAVLALGSLQYTRDPAAAVERFAAWTRPGGAICVLVDSLTALVVELLRAGREEEAQRRLETRLGTWIQGEHAAEHHLPDRAALEAAFEGAGLIDVECRGLLVGASIFGRDELTERLRAGWAAQLSLERRLAQQSVLADLGKQLLAHGRRPG